jgi:hypothetical protein
MEIPRLFKTETIEIEGNEIELRGTRAIDSEYTVALEKKSNEINGMITKVNRFNKNKKEDADYTDKEIEGIISLLDRISELKPEIIEIQNKIAQRGLKRFYFPEIKDTGKIDEVPDIEIDTDTAVLIVNTMIGIDTPSITPLAGEDLKKPGKRQQKKSSKASVKT